MKPFELVTKPWGYEYTIFKENDVKVKILKITKGNSTSMHCHPIKTTSIVVINGQAEFQFLADKKYLQVLDKLMIRRGLFHKTLATSNELFLLEVETPIDDHDLVRINDLYGRENLPYEAITNLDLELFIDRIFIEDKKIKFKDVTIETKLIFSLRDFNHFTNDTIFIFLSGGISKSIDGRLHYLIIPGDSGKLDIIKKILVDGVEIIECTFVMTVSKALT